MGVTARRINKLLFETDIPEDVLQKLWMLVEPPSTKYGLDFEIIALLSAREDRVLCR